QNMIGCYNNTQSFHNEEKNNWEYDEACNTAFGRYPETITYTLGKMTAENNSNMPENDTYENNAYTRYLKNKLNIQNHNVFEDNDSNYDNMINMAISEDNIPDVMVVNDYSYLKLLVENDMIEDLSSVYEKCASDRIKDIYKSYGSEILDNVTFDGKLMALPETNIENGPNMLWLRKDWMDKLSLEAPKNLTDAENIIKEFIEKDPGNNGDGNTIGLACSPELTSERGYSYTGQADILFAAFNSFPKQWIKNSDGEIVYGSIQKESKSALVYLNKLYKSGILDKQFLLRNQNNIEDIIKNGQCGAFFGLWWSPNNPLMDCLKYDKDAVWQPYMIPTNADGSTSFCSQNPSNKFVVVRKGYEHPEIVMKECSVLFDYFNNSNKEAYEIKQYYVDNVDPTARPFSINIDYKDALVDCYRNITSVLDNEKDVDCLQLIEYSYYEQCKRYLEDPDNASVEDWAAYASRISASSLLVNSKMKKIDTYFFNKETETMSKVWWKLKNLEKQAYLKIITGEETIDYFDKFADDWYKQGGNIVTKEVQEEVNSRDRKD
ncbi:MAG: extracellular solute-binding protein, partial [Clostridium sp.]|nr:extracellular solute-binding protein [Clostridium sp.]